MSTILQLARTSSLVVATVITALVVVGAGVRSPTASAVTAQSANSCPASLMWDAATNSCQ
ncbi:hypothetical protein [Streptacidiphilus melanogenes]|uniref:hypothetical protein n=1 Tax=Streptacidiphilus melanogenes TaxID=411235 RepID=UPI000B082ED8|nr:hypothetical protein [Streptacidiphilus melanogenes]